jgi:threonine dehydrogenase-like Zn-dependent dehydrogenase
VIAGFHQDGPRTVDLQLWNWRGLDVVNAHEREPARYVAGMRRAVDAVASGAVNVAPLLTHRFALGQIDDAFELLATRPDGFVKAVVAP